MTQPPRPHTHDRDGRRRARPGPLASTAIVTALALAGCAAEGAEPPRTPTATSAVGTPIPEPTPGPTQSAKPERPAAMDATTDGALEFATYALALYPYVHNTGDLADWRALSHPECKFCANVVADVENLLAKGNHNEGGEVTILTASALELNPGHSFSAEMDVAQAEFREVDGLGDLVGEPVPADNLRLVFSLFYEGGVWLIRGVEAVTPSA
ncbi:DUF6318 family protein [Cellulomonas chengniuliangii]|uniref:DUF6318 family protein n=1 Tax=Cellulomonas chengniuliangii TaxID=2968084 RepID=A0ABY5KWM1_9CELL|nr:DUF6318 family protein [Cellulomonas chengniuliangii]MCC2310208.1 DUF6318 family protein [Cellulomonas chengniuliangii]UUI74103.1 DUF6318 family protein [Cellulomonas chengniuliangii]